MAELEHYGTPRHSGRYPWGSGKDPYQRNSRLLRYNAELRAKGYSEKERAEMLGFTSSKQFRAFVSIANSEVTKANYLKAVKLKEKQWSNKAIGEAMDPPMKESSVRALLKPMRDEKAKVTENIANVLKETVDKGVPFDIGEGAEARLGVSATKLYTATEYLKQQGYNTYTFQVMQPGTGKYTWVKVLAPPDMTQQEAYANRDKLATPYGWSEDGGATFTKLQPPVSIDGKRVFIRYAEDGGEDRDGTIELRRGVEDLTLGDNLYAQVRIAVDGTHYMKGMALHTDDVPDGYDIVFNTNKKTGTPPEKVFKELKDDPDNPFGASISRQIEYTDKDGVKHLSPINAVNEEGKWDEWSKSLASQFVSKQPVPFAKKQLQAAYDKRKDEFDEIMSLTNPVVKKNLLLDLADTLESDAVDMKAAALPRQSTKVILPIVSLKDNEVYAPTYRDGEEVALVRYPHGGVFEIPLLRVNNLNKEGKNKLGQSTDAIGINKHVADVLSGADFDGDTVLVLPTAGHKIQSRPPLEGLKDFDPKTLYKRDTEEGRMTAREKQLQMGLVSNLITDMTIRNAPLTDIERAVKHSMVVIDAEKHNLDWKASAQDNAIASLMKKYQGKATGGSSTLLSRATGDERVDTFKERIDPTTGKKIRVTKENDVYVDKDGKVKHRQVKVQRLSLYDDANELSSGTPIEAVYASHSNSLKKLAQTARLEALATPNLVYSPSAKKVYASEVASLNAKLSEVQKRKPLERAAISLSTKRISDKVKADPTIKDDKDKYKKLKFRELEKARSETGASRYKFEITDKEWEAIQAGAVSTTTLNRILQRADKGRVRQLSMPRQEKGLSQAQEARIRGMLSRGMTQAQIADHLGISSSTVNRVLKQ